MTSCVMGSIAKVIRPSSWIRIFIIDVYDIEVYAVKFIHLDKVASFAVNYTERMTQ